MLTVKRHDVGVLQSRQAKVLDMIIRCDLEDDLAVRERGLSREEASPPRAPAELGQEQEVAQRLAGLREVGRPGHGAEKAIAVEDHFQLGAPLGESLHQLRQ